MSREQRDDHGFSTNYAAAVEELALSDIRRRAIAINEQSDAPRPRERYVDMCARRVNGHAGGVGVMRLHCT